MKRDAAALTGGEFDVVIVGGGIYGATLLWEAARRGLRACLVEQADFGHATSYSSQKLIHGGLRYLQHADLARFRESVRERRLLSLVAPHLLRLMPVLVPAVGHGIQGREALGLGLALNDLLAADRNRGLVADLRVPRGRILGMAEALELCPSLPREGLSAAALWHEVQVHNSERLLLAFLRGAAEAGAALANRVRMTGLLRRGGRGGPVAGVRAVDEESGCALEIRGRAVIATMGPWTPALAAAEGGVPALGGLRLCQSSVLVTRQLHPTHAVGVTSRRRYADSAAVLRRGSRLLFITPWRGCSLIGTTQEEWTGAADELRLEPAEVERFVGEVAEAWPGAGLTLDDVRSAYVGLLPRAESTAAEPAKHFRILDARAHGVERLVVVVGVKYTTARDVAARALARACRQLGQSLPRCGRIAPLPGGGTGPVAEFLARAEREGAELGLSRAAARALAEDHGVCWREVVGGCAAAELAPVAPGCGTVWAEVEHAVREEMALHLDDVVLRRTRLGEAGLPGADALAAVARRMASLLGWDEGRIARELARTRDAVLRRGMDPARALDSA